MSALFELRAVDVERDGKAVLHSIDAEIREAGVTALVGPSGSGKSTLLRLCNRLEVPSAGEVRYRGEPLDSFDARTLRRRVGMVFQRPTPFPGTVRENLLLADPEASEAAMEQALSRSAISADFLGRDATRLSGGEAQRVCLARTLLTSPEVVLMDEPTSSLDAEARELLEQLACGLTGDGLTVVWVTHDEGQVERIADQVLKLSEGRLVSGTGATR